MSENNKNILQTHVYQCGGCVETFDNRENLVVHVKKHKLAKRRIKCWVCKKSLSVYNLKTHESIHSATRPTYPCGICSNTYYSKYAAENHMSKHKGEDKKKTCPECNEKFVSLNRHIIRVHRNERRHSCIECEKQFITRRDLKEHEKTHTGENQRTCPKCNKLFVSKTGYRLHLRSHANNRQTSVCPICNKSYLGLQQHIKTVHVGRKNKMCPHCNKEYSFNALSTHMKTHDTNRQIFSCTECPATFFYKDSLKMHELVHSGLHKKACPECGKIVSQMASHLRNMHGDQSKTLKCLQCEKYFKNNSSLKGHMLTHSTDGKKTCPTCKKEFTHIKDHMKTHLKTSDRQQYICCYCEKTFFSRIGRREHVAVQHTDRPKFSCSMCNSTFSSLGNLQRHVKHTCMHGNKVQLPCHICSRTFSQPSNLQCHMKLHKEDHKLYPCDICSKQFGEKSSVKTHILAVHNPDKCKVVCPTCKGEYSRFTIKAHLKMHSERPKLRCSKCQKTFFREKALRGHMTRHKGLHKKSCPICNKKVSVLSNHMPQHSDDKKYICAVCNSSYKYKLTYRDHIKSHAKNPLQTCPVCNKSYRKLKIHMLQHKQGPKFHCIKCSQTFKFRSYLRGHMARIHFGQQKKICPICNFKCTNLQLHKQTHIALDQRKTVACSRCDKCFTTIGHLKRHALLHQTKQN